jgi:G3E family GTPase
MTAAGDVTIPVVLVTGFLGSGKTTLIAAALRDPAFDRALVVVNEFGEVGIDHDLLESSSEDTILLANGCLCCTIRGNLVDTLASALAQVAEGRLRRFDRVIVETSGLADPAPFLAFLHQEPSFNARFALAGVVTLCDAGAPATPSRFPEAASQLRMADLVLLTKTDIASAADSAATREAIDALAPDAVVEKAVHGGPDPARALDPALLATLRRAVPHGGPGAYRHGHDDVHGHDDPADAVRRHYGIARLAFVFPPLDPAGLEAVLAALRAAAGPTLLRAKAMLRIAGDRRVAVLHATLTGVAPAQMRELDIDGPGRLVLLLQDTDGAAIAAALTAAGASPFAAPDALRTRPGASPSA